MEILTIHFKEVAMVRIVIETISIIANVLTIIYIVKELTKK